MKIWSDDHPKARLMARKRKAILCAARDTFLRVGYDGASMDSIAAAAGVSIMTLYRHAKSKDELFSAVILGACNYSDEQKAADHDAFMQRPLQEVLFRVGESFQEKLTRPETIALLRIVMVETTRFPHLADAAYRGFVEGWLDNLDGFLALRTEFHAVAPSARRDLVSDFLNSLVGTDVLRVLLGAEGPDSDKRKHRAIVAAHRLLTDLLQYQFKTQDERRL